MRSQDRIAIERAASDLIGQDQVATVDPVRLQTRFRQGAADQFRAEEAGLRIGVEMEIEGRADRSQIFPQDLLLSRR
jgi:hypothetical protein